MARYIVVGDIGGTYFRLQLFQYHNQPEQPHLTTQIKFNLGLTKDYNNLISLLAEFIEETSVEVAVLGIAFPIYDNSCDLRKVGWDSATSAKEVEERFGISKVIFLNDFEAAGYGILTLTPENYIEITRSIQPQLDKPKAVIGPGTGLGECFLTNNGSGYKIWPGEGGQCDFGAKTEEEWRYANFLKKIVNSEDSPYAGFRPCENICVELAIAGLSAFHLYNFMKQEHPEEVSEEFDRLFNESDEKMRVVLEYGLSNDDKLCRRATDMFQRMLGYELGNCAAKMLCYGGIYIIGGLVQKNYKNFNYEKIFEGYFSKPPHIRRILEKIPIYIVTHKYIELAGALYVALQHFKNTHIS